MVNKDIKFENPHKTANDVVDIIGNTLSLNSVINNIFKNGLKSKNDDELRICLHSLLKLLVDEYKK
ncbi:hypothetical protein KKF61_08230 [Patescibacteria group bacterium]|nr:hypothetical protein [Patescibacteria group bacterium]